MDAVNAQSESMGAPMRFAYILVAPDNNRYSAMARISVASVRLTNPGATIHLLTDNASAKAMRVRSDPLLKEVDLVEEVPVPDTSVAVRSRHIKTQLGRLIPSPFVFLDVDTVVREALVLPPDISAEWAVAGCRNLSRVALSEQICQKDISLWKAMGWPLPTGNYLNSGVLFFRETSSSQRLAEAWHSLWFDQLCRTHAHTDQQSLHEVLRRQPQLVHFLPDCYNAQVVIRIILEDDAIEGDPLRDRPLDWDARVWHIYATTDWSRHATAFECLTEKVKETGRLDERDVRRLIRSPHPWRRDFLLDDLFIRRARRAPRLDGAFKMWLEGDRFGAIRQIMLKSIRQNPLRLRLGRLKRRILGQEPGIGG